jgi:hypothetical protein
MLLYAVPSRTESIMRLDRLSRLLLGCPYPAQMEHIDCGILGAGYYPGTRGFSGQSPEGGLMLLGRDFGTKSYYDRLSGMPARDETAPTWQRTEEHYLSFFQGRPVWCTNYLLGVRKNGSAMGNIKKTIDPIEWESYEAYCWDFLQWQVLLQRPRLVLVLGIPNRQDLTVSNRLGKKFDGEVRHTFGNDEGEHTAVVAVMDHPHSLIPRVRQAAARTRIQAMRQIYERESSNRLTG